MEKQSHTKLISKINIDCRESHLYIWIYVEFLASHFNDLSRCISKFTWWTIMEELSICRRLRPFLISWGQKTLMKHCYVDWSSWSEFWFAIICIDMNIILDLSTAIQPFYRRFRLPVKNGSTRRIFLFEIQRREIIIALMCLCWSILWKSNVKNIFIPTLACRSEQSTGKIKPRCTLIRGVPDCAITYHVSTQPAVRAAKHHR